LHRAARLSKDLAVDIGRYPVFQGADYYRQVIDFVRARPDQYEPGFETTFQRLIQKLEPPSTD
jgi:hypothetical protein